MLFRSAAALPARIARTTASCSWLERVRRPSTWNWARRNGPTLRRRLGVFDSTMMMMGIIIGSGIFTTTGIMAQYVPSPTLLIAVWLLIAHSVALVLG